MKVVAVVLNWNGSDILSDTLQSLVNMRVPASVQFEIVVVDNNSSDGSVALVRRQFPQVTLLINPVNLGFAAGNNRGIRYALKTQSEYVWLINSDITLSPDSLDHFCQAALRYPAAGVFGCKIYFYPNFEFYKDRYKDSERGKVFWYAGGLIDWANVLGSHRGVDEVDKGQYDYDLETDFVTGAVMFVRASLFRRVGLLDPAYCFYYEENDFCQRALRSGAKLYFLFRPKAWHKNAHSTGVASPLQEYFITRNRLIFGLRYAPLRSRLALLRQSRRLLAGGSQWQKAAVSDFFARRLGAGSFPLSL